MAGVFAWIVFGALWQLTAAPAASDAAGRNARWRADLRNFATNLPARQLDFFKLIPKEKFEQEMTDLYANIPQLSDAEISLQLTRVAAGLGVAHTMAEVSDTVAAEVYPIRMQWFSDGLGVVYTTLDYRGALGARVVRIGSMTPEEVQTALAPYISHENDARLRHESPSLHDAGDADAARKNCRRRR